MTDPNATEVQAEVKVKPSNVLIGSEPEEMQELKRSEIDYFTCR